MKKMGTVKFNGKKHQIEKEGNIRVINWNKKKYE